MFDSLRDCLNNKNRIYIEVSVERGFSISQDGRIFSPIGEELKGTLDKKGYRFFNIRTEYTRGSKVFVHRLQAFQKFGYKIFEKGIVVRHLDGNPSNNHWDNLNIGTHSDNQMDRDSKDRLRHSVLAASKIRRFTDKEAKEIRDFHDSHKSYKKTMEKFGISSKGSLFKVLKNDYKTIKIAH